MDDTASAAPLPFGLRDYQEGEFGKRHAAGSGWLTASQIPALFGHSRWAGKYAIAAHISGKVPLEGGDNPMTARGQELEDVACRMLAKQGYTITRPTLGMVAEHKTLANFCASPDAIAIGHEDGIIRPTEIKVVADFIHKKTWADGPPLEVELQHQAQLACCDGATHGMIAALVIGSFRFELIPYPTLRNDPAVQIVEGEARKLLQLLREGLLPEPDSHASAAKVVEALHPLDESKELVLKGPKLLEALQIFDDWRAAKARRIKAANTEKFAKGYFTGLGLGVGRVILGNDKLVEFKKRARAGYTAKPTTWTEITLIATSDDDDDDDNQE